MRPSVPLMVGATGFEPATSCSQSRHSTGLSYAPNDRPSGPENRAIPARLQAGPPYLARGGRLPSRESPRAVLKVGHWFENLAPSDGRATQSGSPFADATTTARDRYRPALPQG